MKFSIFLLGALLISSPVCMAQSSGSKLMDYMNDAMEKGSSSGELNDNIAEGLRKQIERPGAKIFLKVATEGALLDQPECKRLRLEFSAPSTALKLTNGGSKDFYYQMRMSMCPGGRPPHKVMSTGEAIVIGKPGVAQEKAK